MLTVEKLIEQIAKCGADQLSVNDFEDWFRDKSENVHRSADQTLIDLSFHVEELFSQRYFADLSEPKMREKLLELSIGDLTLARSSSVVGDQPNRR